MKFKWEQKMKDEERKRKEAEEKRIKKQLA